MKMPWKQYIVKTRVHLYINICMTTRPNARCSRDLLKKNCNFQLCFFDWWISEDRSTPLVGVALINVSQFFFSADHGNTMHSVGLSYIHLYRNVHEFSKCTASRAFSYHSTYNSHENSARLPNSLDCEF